MSAEMQKFYDPFHRCLRIPTHLAPLPGSRHGRSPSCSFSNVVKVVGSVMIHCDKSAHDSAALIWQGPWSFKLHILVQFHISNILLLAPTLVPQQSRFFFPYAFWSS